MLDLEKTEKSMAELQISLNMAYGVARCIRLRSRQALLFLTSRARLLSGLVAQHRTAGAPTAVRP